MSSYTYTIIHENTESSFDITDIRGETIQVPYFPTDRIRKTQSLKSMKTFLCVYFLPPSSTTRLRNQSTPFPEP